MEYFTLDKANEWVTIFKINPVNLPDNEADHYIKITEDLLDEKKCWIIDLRQAKFLSANTRIKLGKFYKENQKKMKENIPGAYYVVSSKIVEAALKCIFIISKPPTPYSIGSKMEDAVQWTKGRYYNNASKTVVTT